MSAVTSTGSRLPRRRRAFGLLIVAATAPLILAAARATSGDEEEVDASRAAILALDGVLVLDVRAPFERRRRPWTRADIRILRVPMGTSQWNGDIDADERRDFVTEVGHHVSRQDPFLVVCEEGIRSRFAALLLRRHGFIAQSIFSGLWGREGAIGLEQALFEEATFPRE